jgi:26S proteasome regulatory subunit N2
VTAASSAALTASHLAGNRSGGGILVMRDTRPDEPVEYIELEANKDLAAAGSEGGEQASGEGSTSGTTTSLGDEADLTGPIAEMPEPFEYPFESDT